MAILLSGQTDKNVLRVGGMVGDILAELEKPSNDFILISADPASSAPVFHLRTRFGIRKCKVGLLYVETWPDWELRDELKRRIQTMYVRPDRAAMARKLAARNSSPRS
jgi:hypothetical protein